MGKSSNTGPAGKKPHKRQFQKGDDPRRKRNGQVSKKTAYICKRQQDRLTKR